jgi:hypothetical protein
MKKEMILDRDPGEVIWRIRNEPPGYFDFLKNLPIVYN